MYGRLAGGARAELKSHDLGRDRGGEEEGLAFGARWERAQAGLDVWEHAARTSGEESVRLIEDHYVRAAKGADGVVPRCLDVVSETAGRSDDDVWSVGESKRLGTHLRSTRDEGSAEVLQSGERFELLQDLKGKLSVFDQEMLSGLERGRCADRVGVRTTAKTPVESSAHLWRIGTTNAIVLPEPVRLPPITSLPSRTAGMHPFWMAVGR